jgi:hypothetical protein
MLIRQVLFHLEHSICIFCVGCLFILFSVCVSLINFSFFIIVLLEVHCDRYKRLFLLCWGYIVAFT